MPYGANGNKGTKWTERNVSLIENWDRKFKKRKPKSTKALLVRLYLVSLSRHFVFKLKFHQLYAIVTEY